GAIWEKLQQLGNWIWEKTAPIRSLAEQAWIWIKNKLGIGEGPEGQNGILQWIQRKAEGIWTEHVKPFIERHKKPLMAEAGMLVLLSPAGPLVIVGGAIAGLVAGIRWIKQNLRDKQQVIQQRGLLKGVIIPALMSAVKSVSSSLQKSAAFVT